jgi:ribonuclease HI
MRANKNDPNLITCATDGSCFPNPNGKGGWAFVAQWKDRKIGKYGHLPRTTNNEAELTAMLHVLKVVATGKFPTLIYTDSKYVQNALTVWRYRWQKNGWTNSVGQPVSNKDLIERCSKLIDTHRESGKELEIAWIKGHVGHPMNELVDEFAGQGRLNPKITYGDIEL